MTGEARVRSRVAELALIAADLMGMVLASAVMEKRWREGLLLLSSLSKERERVLASIEAERSEADWGVVEVSAMLMFCCSRRLLRSGSEKSWRVSCSVPSVVRS